MHSLAIFDKTFDHSVLIKNGLKLTSVKSDQRYGQIWPFTPFTYVKDVLQRQFVSCGDRNKLTPEESLQI